MENILNFTSNTYFLRPLKQWIAPLKLFLLCSPSLYNFFNRHWMDFKFLHHFVSKIIQHNYSKGYCYNANFKWGPDKTYPAHLFCMFYVTFLSKISLICLLYSYCCRSLCFHEKLKSMSLDVFIYTLCVYIPC